MIKFKHFSILLLLINTLLLSAQSTSVESYNTLVNKNIGELTLEQIRTTLLHRINEMRDEENRLHPKRKVKLKPLKYSMKLEEACFYYIAHKSADKIFDNTQPNGLDIWVHWDNDSNGVADRYKILNIKYIPVIKYDSPQRIGGELISIGENIVTTNGSIYQLCEAWKHSPDHWKWMISPIITHVGLGYLKDFPLLINDFAKFE